MATTGRGKGFGFRDTGDIIRTLEGAPVEVTNIDGFVKSPSVLLGAGLRFNFVVAEGNGGSPSRPTSGNPAGCPYHRICPPSPACGERAFYETIVWVTFYEIIKIETCCGKRKGFSDNKSQVVRRYLWS
jgi:hypothetical protein